MGRTRQTARVEKKKVAKPHRYTPGSVSLREITGLGRTGAKRYRKVLRDNIDSGSDDCDNYSDQEEETSELTNIYEREKQQIFYNVSYDSAFYAHYFAVKQHKPTSEEEVVPYCTYINIKRDPRSQFILQSPNSSSDPLHSCSPSENFDEDQHWLGINFTTKYDGNKMKQQDRYDLNLVITLDISGSMKTPFHINEPSSSASKSKLAVAIECISALLWQLRSDDYFSLIVFNTTPTVIQPLTKWSKIKLRELKAQIERLRPDGGTELTKALNKSMEEVTRGIEGDRRYSRVFFMTDMESNHKSDDISFIETVKEMSNANKFTTIVGIGCDLSATTIIETSKTAGCNYCNVMSNEEFQKLMVSEFALIVTPVAFNVQFYIENTRSNNEMDNRGEWNIVKAFGSPEVAFSTFDPVRLSTIFPTQMNSKGEYQSGFLLFKLNYSPFDQSSLTSSALPSVPLDYQTNRIDLAQSSDHNDDELMTLTGADQMCLFPQLPSFYPPSTQSPNLFSPFNIKMEWENQCGLLKFHSAGVNPSEPLETCERISILKSILLVQYTDFVVAYLREFNESVEHVHATSNLSSVQSQVERDEARKTLLRNFIAYFTEQVEIIGDHSLESEMSVLSKILQEEEITSSLVQYLEDIAALKQPKKKNCPSPQI